MTPREKAKAGLRLLEQSVLDLLKEHPEGLTNSEIEHALDIASDRNGEQRGWLSWSVLSGLMNQGRISKQKQQGRPSYRIAAPE
jgi:hypothetical protein